MTNRDGRRRTQLELPIETREAMKDEELAMWKVADQALRMYLGLGEESTESGIKRRISELERERDEHLDIVQSRGDRIAEIDDLLEDLVQQLEDVQARKESYRDQLIDILVQMEERQAAEPSMTVLAFLREIKQAAIDEYGSDCDDNVQRVINDLREKAQSDEFDIPQHRFRRSAGPQKGQASADGAGGLSLNSLEGDD